MNLISPAQPFILTSGDSCTFESRLLNASIAEDNGKKEAEEITTNQLMFKTIEFEDISNCFLPFSLPVVVSIATCGRHDIGIPYS